MVKGLGSQASPVFNGKSAIGQFLANPTVVGRVHYHGDRWEILGRSAEHGRPADVDVLQSFGQGYAGLADGLNKGV